MWVNQIWQTAPGSHGLLTVLKNSFILKTNFKSLWKCEWSWGSPNTPDIFQSLLSHKQNTHSRIKCGLYTRQRSVWVYAFVFSAAVRKNALCNGNLVVKKKGSNLKFQMQEASLTTPIIHDHVGTYREDINGSNSGSLAAELIACWTG